jgi:hypothetical protein
MLGVAGVPSVLPALLFVPEERADAANKRLVGDWAVV